MAGATSLEAVKRKIKFLQEQADGAEDRAERLQKELLAQRKAREQVSMFTACTADQELLIERKNYTSSSCSLSCVCVCSAHEGRQLELMHSEIAGFLLMPLSCKLSLTWPHAVTPQSTLRV